jgi:hypothetical protein
MAYPSRWVSSAAAGLTCLFAISACSSATSDTPSTSTSSPSASLATAAGSPSTLGKAAPVSLKCVSLSRMDAATGLQFNQDDSNQNRCLYNVLVAGPSTGVGLIAYSVVPFTPTTGPWSVADQRASMQSTGKFTFQEAPTFGSGAFLASWPGTACAIYGPSGQTVFQIQVSVIDPSALSGHDACAVVTAAAHELVSR